MIATIDVYLINPSIKPTKSIKREVIACIASPPVWQINISPKNHKKRIKPIA